MAVNVFKQEDLDKMVEDALKTQPSIPGQQPSPDLRQRLLDVAAKKRVQPGERGKPPQ
ncbi:hypothetical protein ES703_117210 [subsurface metagenome]